MSCSTSSTVMPSAAMRSDQFGEPLGLGVVQARGRLVHQQQTRLAARARARSRPAAGGRTTARPACRSSAPCRPTKARARAVRRAASSRAPAAVAPRCRGCRRNERCRPHMTFSSTVMLSNSCRFWNVRPMPSARDLVRQQRLDRRWPSKRDGAAVERLIAADQVEQRGLAGAVRADQRGDRAGLRR